MCEYVHVFKQDGKDPMYLNTNYSTLKSSPLDVFLIGNCCFAEKKCFRYYSSNLKFVLSREGSKEFFE